MRLRALVLTLAWLSLAIGQPPAPVPAVSAARKEYLEKRAAILRQMAEMKAKLASLELDLQLLEEGRTAEPAPPPPATSWREEAVSGGEAPKKAIVRCLSVTRGGKRCSRTAEAGGKYCWQHRLH